jgi:hypothetical protein
LNAASLFKYKVHLCNPNTQLSQQRSGEKTADEVKYTFRQHMGDKFYLIFMTENYDDEEINEMLNNVPNEHLEIFIVE